MFGLWETVKEFGGRICWWGFVFVFVVFISPTPIICLFSVNPRLLHQLPHILIQHLLLHHHLFKPLLFLLPNIIPILTLPPPVLLLSSKASKMINPEISVTICRLSGIWPRGIILNKSVGSRLRRGFYSEVRWMLWALLAAKLAFIARD